MFAKYLENTMERVNVLVLKTNSTTSICQDFAWTISYVLLIVGALKTNSWQVQPFSEYFETF